MKNPKSANSQLIVINREEIIRLREDCDSMRAESMLVSQRVRDLEYTLKATRYILGTAIAVVGIIVQLIP